MRTKPKLRSVSEEMKRLAELLEGEVLGWPNVTSRPMFGMTGLYSGRKIFAVLPRTRALNVPDSIGFRLLKRPQQIVTDLDLPLEVRVRPWYNPALESAVYIVPGVIGLLLTLTMTLITAMAIVRERERGTLEQLIVTPITRTGVMLGKTLPFVVVGYVQMTVILLLGHFVFGVPIRGSLTLLYSITFLYIMASLAFGCALWMRRRTFSGN